METLIFLAAIYAAILTTSQIRETIGESPFLFLRLFTMTTDWLPLSLIGLLGILIPLVAVALAFDSVNGEFNRRTLSRVLAQPIYRDALLLGKFLGALLSLSTALASLWLLVIGIGLFRLGLPPSTEEMIRMLGFLVATTAYGGVWLALAMLFSVLFRAPATAVLAALGSWLVFSLFWPIITPIVTSLIAGSPEGRLGPNLTYINVEQIIDRLSPNTLYAETTLALLNPTTRALGPVLVTRSEALSMAAVGPTPLPVTQSFVLIWPQLTGLIAATILIYAIAYVLFQRQEIRA